jgi:OmcA/MtrC family decaheme c-type cytochrome
VKSIWNGTATGTGAGTLAGPDASGFYTITLTGVQVSAAARMLTGGVGFTYSLSSTPPLTQVNLTKYPYVAPGASGTVNGTPVTIPAGKAVGYGGLIVPAADVWKVGNAVTTGTQTVGSGGAGGQTPCTTAAPCTCTTANPCYPLGARRTIVANSKCNGCHVSIGAAPTFHAGQRNDGPSCTWCHNPNRTSSGWSANAKDFLHSLHAGRIREVPFNWHASAPGEDFSGVGFPAALDTCTACHVTGGNDFSNAAVQSQFPNMLDSSVGVGVYNSDPVTNATGWFQISPYVVSDNVFNYGAGFSYNAGTNVTTQAAATTLVKSPITSACSACHDSPAQIAHMETNGGSFYQTRTVAAGRVEQCLICHGPNSGDEAIGKVHK